MYLITLVLIFITILIKGQFPKIEKYIEYIYLFFAIGAFIVSFRLPSSLMNLHQERIEHEIEARRKAEGIKD